MSYFDDLNEFTDEEIANNGVSSANDALEGSAAENKKVFDRLPKYIAGRINIIISLLRSFASSIDAKITDLKNYIDSFFLLKEDLPTNISYYNNDSGYITAEEVPDNLSSYNNDAGFITDEAVPKKLSQLENDTLFVTEESIPKKVSELENDVGFINLIDETVNDFSVMGSEGGLSIGAYYLTLGGGETKLSGNKITLETYSDADIDVIGGKLAIEEPENANHAASKRYVDEGFVKKTDYARIGNHGVVSTQHGFGVMTNANGILYTTMASNALIDEKLNEYNPIVPANLEYAVKSVGDGYYATEEQVGDIDAALFEIMSLQGSYSATNAVATASEGGDE